MTNELFRKTVRRTDIYPFKVGSDIIFIELTVLFITQTESGAHPASYPMGIEGGRPWGKAADA
jgi:hypothetical protein